MGSNPLRILIAEDDAAHAEAITRAFEVGGWVAETLTTTTLADYGLEDLRRIADGLPCGRRPAERTP